MPCLNLNNFRLAVILIAALVLCIFFQEIAVSITHLPGNLDMNLAIPAILSSPATLSIKKSDLKQFPLEKDMHKEATNLGLNFEDYLLKKEAKEGVELSPDAARLSAVDRQLMAHGINPFSSSTLVEDFYKTPDSKILVPAFISQQIYIGMGLGKMDLSVEDLKASSQRIPTTAIEQIGLDFSKEDVKMKKVTEGAALPTATITTKEKPGSMKKVGRQIKFTYEAVRRVNIDIVKIYFQRMGFIMGRQMAQEGLRVLVDGDGNSGSASPTSETATTTYKYADLIDLLYGKFMDGHEASHVVLSKEMFLKLLTDETNFKPFQSVNLLENFVKTGQVQSFFGLNWKTHSSIPDNHILAFEKSTCLAYYEEAKSAIAESDKIIDQQFERSTVSLNFGFSKLFQAASHLQTKKA
jgi:hypothetical protein